MTGRRAARDHEDPSTGPTVGGDPEPAVSRGGGVAPQPRPVPAVDPGAAPRPSPAPRPGPAPRSGPAPRPGPAADPQPARRPAPGGRAAEAGRDDPANLAATPVRPTPAAPTPSPVRPAPAAPTPSPARPAPPVPPTGAEAVEVEPTTGAPVDAVPSRVPVRQQNSRQGGRRPGDDQPEDDGAFWAPIEQVHWDGTPVRADPSAERDRYARPARRRASRAVPPDPLPGLAALVTLTLVTAFFAWVSAGPFWLAVGHARVGTVVIAECAGGGLTLRCRGIFTAQDGRFIAHGVRVSGVPAGAEATGTPLPARMTGRDGGTAYADTGLVRHLRWLPGLLVVLGCTAAIVRCTGSARLPGRRHRRWAVALAVTGPVLITVGFLAAAW
ncbi:hypothetical protein AB0B85_28180 [Micromonospora sp. NPDC049044]|uniref:hypothetical protein n=1 Tax=unclassified Micromonospora TaxID=2617518 RepID=UPI0033F9A2D9